jgi:hypothetical protein
MCERRNVNSKCTHRQMTRLWPSKEGPCLSSERAPLQRQDNKFQTQTLEKKQYLVKRPQSGLDTKTYWVTKDRPGLSSERTPHRDRTTNPRPKLLKRKQYLVKRPQSGLDTKTDWLTDWLSAVKWPWIELQRTDLVSHQRGRPTETGQQIPYPNSWKGSNIWSNVHRVGLTPRLTDWLTVSRKVTLTLWNTETTPLVLLSPGPGFWWRKNM